MAPPSAERVARLAVWAYARGAKLAKLSEEALLPRAAVAEAKVGMSTAALARETAPNPGSDAALALFCAAHGAEWPEGGEYE